MTTILKITMMILKVTKIIILEVTKIIIRSYKNNDFESDDDDFRSYNKNYNNDDFKSHNNRSYNNDDFIS